MSGVANKMEVNKPLEHINYIVIMLCLNSKFDSNLLPLKVVLEDDIDWNLRKITKLKEMYHHDCD